MKKLFDTKQLFNDAKDALIGGGYEYAINKVALILGDKLPANLVKAVDSIAALIIYILIKKTKVIKNKETAAFLRKKCAGDMLQGIFRLSGVSYLGAATPFLEGIEGDIDNVIEALEEESYPDIEIQGYGEVEMIEGNEIAGASDSMYDTSDSDGGLY